MRLTYFGHSCFSVEISGKTLLFDPFISHNELAKDVNINKIHADFILISHGHEDHIADTIEIAKKSGGIVTANFEVANWLSKKGVENLNPMNIGGQKDLGFAKIKCVDAKHSSSMPDGSYGGNPMGFVVTSKEGNFYYAGDTGLTMDMQLIPSFSNIDFAILPIGDHFTMGYEDALTAASYVKTAKVIGVHYNTFPPIMIDKSKAKTYFLDRGTELLLPEIGTTINI